MRRNGNLEMKRAVAVDSFQERKRGKRESAQHDNE
jgi:hypothetical protein